MKKGIVAIVLTTLLLTACVGGQDQKATDTDTAPQQENTEAKALLQGVWLDSESEEVFLKAQGDTIFFADATNQPARFSIVGDSLLLGNSSYLITMQTEHNFRFRNAAGEEVALVKRDSTDTYHADFTAGGPQIISTTQAVNLDSVVMYGGQRYHWYITVNPTRNRVTRTTFTADGVAVEKVYYDNIIHVSLFKMNQRLFTRDFNKRAYADNVPLDFLEQSILGNIRYSHVDAKGFHFYATVCIPDGESCYMIETLISFEGQLTMKLEEY